MFCYLDLCSSNSTKSANTNTSLDQKAIKDVLVKAYKWQESNTSQVDFEPISDKKKSIL
jgi:hypothetical protein